jgi:hypothetical protein
MLSPAATRASAARFNAIGYSRRFISSSPRETVPYFRVSLLGCTTDVLAVFAVFCSKLSAAEILVAAGILGVDSSANERTARLAGWSAALFWKINKNLKGRHCRGKEFQPFA